MTHPSSTEAVFGFTGLQTTLGGLVVSRDLLTRIGMPASLTYEQLIRARRDAEIVLQAMYSHPEAVTLVVNAVLTGDVAFAREQAERLGLAEASMVDQGGGYLWLVVVVIAIGSALTLMSDAPILPVRTSGAP